MKKVFSILFLLITSCFLQGQTLVSINGGLNLGTFVHRTEVNVGTISSNPSFGAGIEIKGRAPKPFHIGFAAEYNRTSFNWKWEELHGLGPSTWKIYDLNYDVDYLRLSVFPEFSIGDRFQFFFNMSPYVGFMIQSSKKGTYQKSNDGSMGEVSGKAGDDIGKFDFGIRGSMGIGFAVKPFFVISIEETGNLGIKNMNKIGAGGINSAGLATYLCFSFIIPKGPAEEKTKSK